ncbi:hypothetical protein [Paraflavitalea pollutisoli]|uniref:hypothetical protein n=1 Tax=Paraflavitalea pollutisoli TaxID=3034143 RepID=UPI0023EC1B3D|nr:hypothetical protein [Paraflavitalea sp. H1-2-19X]
MNNTYLSSDILNNSRNNRPTKDGIVIKGIDFPVDLDVDIVVENVSFKQYIRFKGCKSKHLIRFVNCTFEGLVNIYQDCQFKEVHFVNCTFNSTFTVIKSTIGHFTLKDNTFKKGIDTEEISGEKLCIYGAKSDNAKFKIVKPEYKNIILSEARDNSEYIFSAYEADVNALKRNESNTGFTYVADSQFKGSVLVAGLKLGTLSLHGHNTSGRITFQQLLVGLVNIGQFTNTGILSFANIEPDPFTGTIQCHRSNLGKCEIYDVNFALFRQITIDNTNIQDIITTNITWCRNVRSALIGIDAQAHLRENYRQLKNIMIRQNDKVQELAYHRQEMNALLLAMRFNRGNRFDRFIIWSNGISNAHGLSWERAGLWLLVLTWLSYFSINYFVLGKTEKDATQIFKHIALFFESLNPVRKFNAIYDDQGKDQSASNLAYFIDVIYRFIASYLIFQFISAFRKYVKK